MMTRCGGFFRPDGERESRQAQQRDYAAQLQEQVRQKNARVEQEKTRKRLEQQVERDNLLECQEQRPQQRPAPESACQNFVPENQHRTEAAPAKPSYEAAREIISSYGAEATSTVYSTESSIVKPFISEASSLFDPLLQHTLDTESRLQSLRDQCREAQRLWKQRRAQIAVIPELQFSMKQASTETMVSSKSEQATFGARCAQASDERNKLDGLPGDSVMVPVSKYSPVEKKISAPSSNRASSRRAEVSRADLYAEGDSLVSDGLSRLVQESTLVHINFS